MKFVLLCALTAQHALAAGNSAMAQLSAKSDSTAFLTLKQDITDGITSLQVASQDLVESGADPEEVQMMLEECMASGSDASGLGDLESEDVG